MRRREPGERRGEQLAFEQPHTVLRPSGHVERSVVVATVFCITAFAVVALVSATARQMEEAGAGRQAVHRKRERGLAISDDGGSSSSGTSSDGEVMPTLGAEVGVRERHAAVRALGGARAGRRDVHEQLVDGGRHRGLAGAWTRGRAWRRGVTGRFRCEGESWCKLVTGPGLRDNVCDKSSIGFMVCRRMSLVVVA